MAEQMIEGDSRWSDGYLESMRSRCDPIADQLVREFLRDNEPYSAHQVMLEVMNYRVTRRNPSGALTLQIPAELIAELKKRDPPPAYDASSFYPALRFFRDYGPELLTMLGYYSLPTTYGAANGVHVLAATGYLEHRTIRRVIETAQLVIDVLKPGGMDNGGDGIHSAYEVRLMHAAIRNLIWEKGDWNLEYGEPINQEDLAGTLLAFSTLILDGFDKLNVYVSPATKESYFSLWAIVARMMGLRDGMVPTDYAESWILWRAIFRRQMKGSDTGRKLLTALSGTYDKLLPAPFAKELNSSFFRFYLDPRLADGLGVPKNLLLDLVGHVLGSAFGPIEEWAHSVPIGRDAYRWFSRNYILALTVAGRGHDMRAPFDLPLELSDYWKVPSSNAHTG